MAKRVALITGVTGQDGAYLPEFLLNKRYIVHGIKCRSSSFNTGRVDHLYQDPHEAGQRFVLHYGDMTDATNLIRVVQDTQPDEIYNLAAQSHVHVSFETPEYTANADGLGTLRLLEAIRILGMEKRAILSSVDIRVVWNCPGNRILSAFAICDGKTVCLLGHCKLPRGLRLSRFKRNPIQS